MSQQLMKFEEFLMLVIDTVSAELDVLWNYSGLNGIVELCSGDFVNLTALTRAEVGPDIIKIHWGGGDSTLYQGDDAKALKIALGNLTQLRFVRPKKPDQ